MVDTHAHIRKGDEIRIDGLDWVILSASELEDSVTNIELASKNTRLLSSVGIHPQAEVKNVSKTLMTLKDLLVNNKEVVAVGECGLDFSREHDKAQQEELFRGQIELSLKFNKPLIVHSRKAIEETLDVLGSYRNLRGVIHCYSGGKKRIKKVLDLPGEWYFGIDGNVTYEDGLQEVVKNIPSDKLLLETDSPELTPIPFRGEKNYPEYVKYVYEKVAEIWDLSIDEVETIVDGNARKLFQIV